MSKIKFLLAVVQDIRSLADSLEVMADAMCDSRSAPNTLDLKPTGNVNICAVKIYPKFLKLL